MAAAALAFTAGTVRVDVAEKKPGGARVNILLPAALVPVGMTFVPERERQELAARLVTDLEPLAPQRVALFR